ncbi:hypothetical protein [Curtobacterium citreum]|uniref:hypothetical protein n=1 Tax=Curtobacterium citreum TaxID=2036 RepID=UPI00254309C5|nr:hypothetical protein [Curtobacterium citreum]WIJ45585.1 hypothetical protein QPK07_01095 [Curtobacterium citreum]
MNADKLTLAPLPASLGDASHTLQARRRLESSHQTVQGVLNGLRDARLNRGASRGTPRDTDKDLLRAAIAFAGAGVDATLKALLRDALPTLVLEHGKSGSAVKAFAKMLFDEEPKTALKVLVSGDPTRKLHDEFVQHRTKGSLQATSDLKQARAALGLSATGPLSDDSIDALEMAFAARNQIIHELDLKTPSGRGDWSKHSRTMTASVSQIDQLFAITVAFVQTTDKLLETLGRSASTAR